MGMTWVTGVCLRNARLEWTVLRRAKEAWEVHAQGEADGPPESGEGGGGWAAVLKAQGRHFQGRVAVALPTDRVLVRVALLPSVDGEELRGMAELQTDKYSPFPVESMALGAEVAATAGTSSLVAMAAARREVVEETGRLFLEAGGLPDVVDVEALAWWWGLRHAGQVPSHGAQVFVRAQADVLEMLVARDGAPLIFRPLPLPPADPAQRGSWVSDCAEDAEYALTSIETEWGTLPPPSLHVFHDPGPPPAWAGELRAALGLETLFTHEVTILPRLSEGVARRAAEPAEPLAMDLAPDEWRAADAARALRRRMWRAATIFLATWAVGVGAFLALLNVQRGRMDRLQAQVAEVEGPAREIRQLRGKVLEFAQYADRTHSALECLRVVAETLPEGMDLASFIYRKGSTLSLRGEADEPDKVYRFILAMENTRRFMEVKSEGINTPPGQKSKFNILVRLQGAGEEEP